MEEGGGGGGVCALAKSVCLRKWAHEEGVSAEAGSEQVRLRHVLQGAGSSAVRMRHEKGARYGGGCVGGLTIIRGACKCAINLF